MCLDTTLGSYVQCLTSQARYMHRELAICPSCVPEKVGVSKKGVNQNDVSIRKNGFSRVWRNKTQSAKGR